MLTTEQRLEIMGRLHQLSDDGLRSLAVSAGIWTPDGGTPPRKIPEFKDFGKIERFRTMECVIAEKADGSNVQIYVPDDPEEPLFVGSRNRWIYPGKHSDMCGFAEFVQDNQAAFRRLGVGRHYGEWWGRGIQRNYGQEGRHLSLFSVDRFPSGLPDGLPSNVSLIPVLYRGETASQKIKEIVEGLYRDGSVLVPGWAKPEGVVLTIGGKRYKITDNGDKHKGQS